MSILQLLASDSFITFNKHIAKKYGLEEAVLLGAMCSYQVSFGGNEFYKEQEIIMEDTTLTLYSLRKATKVLCDANILKIKKKGVPAKNYYLIDEQELYKCLSTRPIEFDTSSSIENNTTSDSENNTTINDNTINDNSITNKPKKKKKEELLTLDTFKCSEEVMSSIQDWLAFKKEKRQTYTPRGLNGLLKNIQKDINKFGEQYVINAIEHSIGQNYSGIFPPKQNTYSKPKQQLGGTYYDKEDLDNYDDR